MTSKISKSSVLSSMYPYLSYRFEEPKALVTHVFIDRATANPPFISVTIGRIESIFASVMHEYVSSTLGAEVSRGDVAGCVSSKCGWEFAY